MKKTITTLLGAALIASSMMSVASAESRHVRKADHAATSNTAQSRNANATMWPSETAPYNDARGNASAAPAGH